MIPFSGIAFSVSYRFLEPLSALRSMHQVSSLKLTKRTPCISNISISAEKSDSFKAASRFSTALAAYLHHGSLRTECLKFSFVNIDFELATKKALFKENVLLQSGGLIRALLSLSARSLADKISLLLPILSFRIYPAIHLSALPIHPSIPSFQLCTLSLDISYLQLGCTLPTYAAYIFAISVVFQATLSI